MKSLPTYLFFSFISSLILWNCASIQKPSGGAKDLDPPLVLETYPRQESTNVQPSKIQIHFDEFFILKNFQSELLISPPLNEKPIISQKGKSLFIELVEDLKENTTYTFNFGKGIADFHEGNILKDFSLVFSTGNEIDSLHVHGTVLTCPNNKSPENVIVGLYQKDSLLNDSTVYLQKPNYYSVIDDKGNFHIDHIREGEFELIAFNDANANYLYDGVSEQIAFKQKSISSLDSSQKTLWLFTEEAPWKLLDMKNNSRLHWTYNKDIDSAKIQSSQAINYYSKIEKDSLFVWPVTKDIDSVHLWVEIGNRSDSIFVKPDSLISYKKPKALLHSTYLKTSEDLTINFTEPITSIDRSKIKLIADSTNLEYNVSISDFQLNFDFPHKGNQQYQLVLDKGAVMSVFNEGNDSTALSFYSKADNALAALKINMELNETSPYFIELLKGDEIVGRKNANEALLFKKLLPSKYILRITVDSNNDGKWTAGNYFNRKQPEKVYYYQEELNLRANWELEIDWLIE